MTWFLLIAFIFLFSFAYAANSGAPWVPTRKRDIDRVIRLLDVKPDDTVYELGCGDGRVSLLIAKQTGVHVVGVELSLAQWIIAQIRKWLSGASRVSFRLGNIFSTNLSDADAVYFFLMPETYEKLRPKLERELKPGARVVSYVWPIPGWEPTKVDREKGRLDLYVYIREFPRARPDAAG